MSFSEILKGLREKRGLSQKELAELTGITQATVSRYESGKREPKWADVQRLAKSLNVSCTYFKET